MTNHKDNHQVAEVRRLRIPARYSNIPAITNFAAEAAQAAHLDETSVFHCQLALDEAITNVIEHAYGEREDGDLEVTIIIEPGVCTLQIVDWGEPFDPDSVPEPNLNWSDIDKIKPGGIGLHLMRKLMDEVSFTFSEGVNRLVMVKRTESPEEAASDGETVTLELERNIWLVSPSGRIDSSAAPAFEETLHAALAGERRWLIVDLHKVDYVSSRGLKALVTAWREARAAGGDLIIAAMQPRVQNVFETVGFTRIFTVCKTREAAVERARAYSG